MILRIKLIIINIVVSSLLSGCVENNNSSDWDRSTVIINDSTLVEYYSIQDTIWPYALKSFYVNHSQKWYRNVIHGFEIRLPDGMEYNQTGELCFDNNGNEFYIGNSIYESLFTISCYVYPKDYYIKMGINVSEINEFISEKHKSKNNKFTHNHIVSFNSAKYGDAVLLISISWSAKYDSEAKEFIGNIGSSINFVDCDTRFH